MVRRLTLGRVAGVFGVRGWVKLHSYTRPIENLLDYSRWTLLQQGKESVVTLLEGQVQNKGLIAQLGDAEGKPIADRDVAAALIGAEILVDRDDMPEPDEGEHYWADLVGCKVVNEDGVELGIVDSLTSNGAQDVLVLTQGEVERLIPYVKGPIIKSVDMGERVIVADWQLDY